MENVTQILIKKYFTFAIQWKRARKPTKKALYIGQMEGIKEALIVLIGEKDTIELINNTATYLKL